MADQWHRHESSIASLWRAFVTVMAWLSPVMVEGRPLHPQSLAMVSSDQRPQVFYNFQAGMPSSRPLCSITASCWSSVPSGSVPGDGVLGCDAWRRCGGEGIGPDYVLGFSHRVLIGNSEGLVIIAIFFWYVLGIVTLPLIINIFSVLRGPPLFKKKKKTEQLSCNSGRSM
jgi:hypothetical protein